MLKFQTAKEKKKKMYLGDINKKKKNVYVLSNTKKIKIKYMFLWKIQTAKRE